MVTQSRAVLTLAAGNPIYLQMAFNLARSFFWWHRNSPIQFFLAADIPVALPDDLKQVRVIELTPGELGTGFAPKLHLDRLVRAVETLFIDADSLCVGDLTPVFDRFVGCNVSVVGREESDGELFGDIETRCRAVGVAWIPRFCGGLYFIRRGEIAGQIFNAARQLCLSYEELGLQRLRGYPNEEPLIGLGMALFDEHPIPEDGTVKAEPMFFSGKVEIDVFKGSARLSNSPAKPKPLPEWHIPSEAKPRIVHFNCSHAEKPPYTTEALRLRKVCGQRWPMAMATAYSAIFASLPFILRETIKDIFRPIYHAILGPRAVRQSPRL